MIAALVQTLQYRDMVGAEMKHIVAMALNDEHSIVEHVLETRSENIDFDCYEPAVRHYSATCREVNAVGISVNQRSLVHEVYISE